MKSIVRGQWRYVESPLRELYDRDADPGETENLVESNVGLADELREMLFGMTSQFKAFETSAVAADASSRSMLESLGYVGASAAGEAPSGSLKDPKSMMETYGRYTRAQTLLDSGKPQEALPLFEAVVRETPESDELYVSLGKIYLMLGRAAEAEQAIIKSLRKQSNDPFKLWVLGESLRRQQKNDKAIECFRKAVELMPDMEEGHRSLAMVYSAQRDFHSAYEPCRKYAELKPQSPAAWTNLGNVCLALRRMEEANSYFEKAIQLDPKSREALKSYSQGLLFIGRRLEAIAAMRRAIEANPDDESIKTPFVWLIGITQGVSAETLAEGMRLGQEQVARMPNDARALDALAAVCAASGRFDEAVNHARKAADLAAAAGDSELAGKIEARIALYAGKKPFRSE
ncbi:MAG: tetratricopeptide repeat protein [Planctomycetes bacterium]|nr:tetratricopeptide repeat protein [Planctomycetota bacterium]